MQDKTTKGLRAYVGFFPQSSNVTFVPVGDAFRAVYSSCDDPSDPTSLFARLYAPDAFHPSRLGTYLSCLVFFVMLTGRTPVGGAFRPRGCEFDSACREKKKWSDDIFPLEMGEDEAEALQHIAWDVCKLYLRKYE